MLASILSANGAPLAGTFGSIVAAEVNDVEVLAGSADPSAGAGVAAAIPALYLRSTGALYSKTGAGDTAWTLLVSTSAAATLAALTATTGLFSGLLTAQLGVAVAAGPTIITGLAVNSASNHVAIDAALASKYKHALTENTTIDNFANAVADMVFRLTITQHASAAKTVAFGSYFTWQTTAPSIVNSGLSKRIHIDVAVIDATHYDCVWSGPF
jgi:hypothetical protein